MSTGVAAAPSIRGGITATRRKPGRRTRGRPVRATARDDDDDDGAVRVRVWQGGGDGLVRPAKECLLAPTKDVHVALPPPPPRPRRHQSAVRSFTT